MKSRILIMTILLGMLAGCTDTADSISREYRNQINEGLDAMMLVTDEATAKQMTVRVFKPMGDRFKDIDRRLDIVRANRTKKEFAVEFTESDSVHMFVSEIFLNRGRYSIEMSRLKNLTKQVIEKEREAHAKLGKEGPFDPKAACPELQQLITDSGVLGALDGQLNQPPKIFGFINTFKDWKLDKWEELVNIQKKKRERFGIKVFGELK